MRASACMLLAVVRWRHFKNKKHLSFLAQLSQCVLAVAFVNHVQSLLFPFLFSPSQSNDSGIKSLSNSFRSEQANENAVPFFSCTFLCGTVKD